MGSMPVEKFFLSCDNGYLISNLTPQLHDQIADYDHLDDWLKKSVCKLRRELDVTKKEARGMFNEILSDCRNNKEYCESPDGYKLLNDIIGDEWWYSIPSVSNPKYVYLSRVVDVVKEGLKTLEE